MRFVRAHAVIPRFITVMGVTSVKRECLVIIELRRTYKQDGLVLVFAAVEALVMKGILLVFSSLLIIRKKRVQAFQPVKPWSEH